MHPRCLVCIGRSIGAVTAALRVGGRFSAVLCELRPFIKITEMRTLKRKLCRYHCVVERNCTLLEQFIILIPKVHCEQNAGSNKGFSALSQWMGAVRKPNHRLRGADLLSES